MKRYENGKADEIDKDIEIRRLKLSLLAAVAERDEWRSNFYALHGNSSKSFWQRILLRWTKR